MMKTAVRKKACLDQTYPMTRFAPCYPTNNNIYEILLYSSAIFVK